MKKLIKIILMVCVAAAIGIGITGFVIPIRLEIDVNPDKLYQYEDLTRDDVTVYLSPLFKRGKKIDDFIFEKKSTDQYDDITVQQTIFYKAEHIRNVKLKSIDAKYQGKPHEGDKFNENKIVVTAHYKDGSDVEITDFKVLNAPETLDVNTDVVVKTSYGSAPLEIDLQKIKEIRATYPKSFEGDEFDKEKVNLVLVYDDGEEPIKDFEYEGESRILGKTQYKIYTTYGPTILTIEPILVKYAIADDRVAEQEFSGSFKMVYEDGTEKALDTSDVTFLDDTMLSYGVNKIPFLWNDNTYTLFVYASPKTRVTEAINNLQEEISASLYNEFSKRIFVTIRGMNYDGIPYYLTHIVLSDPSQIYVESANGRYGNGLESPTKAAARTQWVIGTNGSFFDTMTGLPLSTCLIRGNRIVQYGTTSGREICITNSGGIFSPPAVLM